MVVEFLTLHVALAPPSKLELLQQEKITVRKMSIP
jgi:hypothetical protein